jgi:uncharacterized phosphosugar-binding protein
MLMERYFAALQSLVDEIAAEPEPLREVARVCADALARGGVIHIFDSGHMVSQELVRRAGGLVAFSSLAFSLNVSNPVRTRHSPDVTAGHSPDAVSGQDGSAQPRTARDTFAPFAYIKHIFESSQLRAGDVLIIGSVSGKTANVIELALQARAHGLTVIALTALGYSSRLTSDHPSGKRLYEAADLVLDNHAPYGDAMLEVEGAEAPICPASGIGAAVVLWAVVAGIVEEMLSMGLTPSVYPSTNLPDGPDRVALVEANAAQRGY